MEQLRVLIQEVLECLKVLLNVFKKLLANVQLL
jgi:hypothetical protein